MGESSTNRTLLRLRGFAMPTETMKERVGRGHNLDNQRTLPMICQRFGDKEHVCQKWHLGALREVCKEKSANLRRCLREQERARERQGSPRWKCLCLAALKSHRPALCLWLVWPPTRLLPLCACAGWHAPTHPSPHLAHSLAEVCRMQQLLLKEFLCGDGCRVCKRAQCTTLQQ